MLVGLGLVALNLRPAVTSVGPLLTEIVHSLGFDRAEAGILTTLPVLCFGLIGPAAPVLGRRYGAENVIFAALIAVAIGCAMRLVSSAAMLYASGVVAGLAIAAKALKPSIRLFAAEPLGADDAARSKAAGAFIPQISPQTIADGLLTSMGDLTWPVVRVRSCPPPLTTCDESPEPLPLFSKASLSGEPK